MGVYGVSGPNTLQRVDLDMALIGTRELAQREGLVGVDLCPIVTVGGKSGKFPVVDEKEINQRLISDERLPTGRFNELSLTWRTGSYDTSFYGLGSRLDRQEVAIYEDYLEQDILTAEAIMVNMLKNYEKRVLTMAAAAVAATYNPTTSWLDPASTPVKDMITWKLELRSKRRVFRDSDLRLLLDYEVVQMLKLNSDIKDRLSVTMDKLPDQLDESLIARALGVGKILVGNSWENQSSQGTPEDEVTYALQWSKNTAFLCIASARKDNAHRWANTLKWRKGITGWQQSYDWDTDADKLRYRDAYGLFVVDAGSALKCDIS